jgi:TPR repeat protein
MADLRCLTLLRNDPEDAARLLQEAEQGDLDAQYAMGLIYAEGRGIPVDEARSFFWLTVAGERGDQDALVLRRVVAAQMTESQFEAAERLLAERRPGRSPAIVRSRRRRRGGSDVH